jgi:hypothetical protein
MVQPRLYQLRGLHHVEAVGPSIKYNLINQPMRFELKAFYISECRQA